MGPWGFGILIGGIILLAILVILYFMIFRQKIASGMEARGVRKENEAQEFSKAAGMASTMFESRENQEDVRKETKTAADIEKILKPNPTGVKVEKKVKEKPKKVEPTPFNVMGQFQNKSEEIKPEQQGEGV